MHRKNKEKLFVVILIIVILAMIIISASRDSFRVNVQKDIPLMLSQSEKQFIAKKDVLYIAVSEKLQYLNHEFLEEYIEDVLEQSGLKILLVDENDPKADCEIDVVTESLRKKVDHISFTTPLLQITGTMFVREQYKDQKPKGSYINGAIIKEDLVDEEKQALSYDGMRIRLVETDTLKQAVKLAMDKKVDCIIGDQTAITAALKKEGLEEQYVDLASEFYKKNVCIIMDKKEHSLYSIVNQCIQNADRPVLMHRAQEKWFGITGTFVEAERYKDMAALLVIVFAAVFCAFFFYYQSNKNLYNELTDRMNQLIASKQEMQTTFNGVSYYMAELDPEGYILDINQALLKYVNKECLGRHISTVLEVSEEHSTLISTMIAEAKNVGKSKMRHIVLKKHFLEISIFPIEDPKGNAEKLLFMACDITEVKMAERQMLQDNKMIAVGQLAAGVAHEIRNPLGLIRNYCYVLKNMEDEETRKQAIQVIEKSVDTSSKIIDNLLNFSRISNKIIDTFYIKKHIDSVILLNEGKLKKKQIQILVNCSEDFVVNLAVESFDMIFINLLSNGIDAMEEGGHLTVTVERAGDEFAVLVTDTGTGIEEEILEDIFNPFFTTKSNTEGNGLGLYIVYNEVKKMNGAIEVTSKVNSGTTFTITLPVQLEERDIE